MPIAPTIIKGPAKLTWNSFTYFTLGDITVTPRHTFNPINSSIAGKVVDVLFSTMFEISFQPVGMKPGDFTQFFPYQPVNVGDSIFGSNALVILTKDGRSITYHEAGVLTSPQLDLSPRRTIFGDMSFAAIGVQSGVGTGAANFKTEGSTAWAWTGYNEATIYQDLYSAAYGATPYDSIAALDGFQVDAQVETSEIESDDQGISDIVVTSVAYMAKFAPSNLTAAQLDTMCALQGASASVPGTRIESATDLIITPDNTGVTTTLKNALPSVGGQIHSVSAHQHQDVEFRAGAANTTGTPDALITWA